MKVLIVEDHALIRRGLSEVMREAFKSLEVGEASNFRAAFELVDSTDWDIVLLDINIPCRSGLELLEITKRRRPSTPVLVLRHISRGGVRNTIFPDGCLGLREQECINRRTSRGHQEAAFRGQVCDAVSGREVSCRAWHYYRCLST